MILAINRDIIFQIIEYLSLSDIRNLALVCRHLKEVCYCDSVWTPLFSKLLESLPLWLNESHFFVTVEVPFYLPNNVVKVSSWRVKFVRAVYWLIEAGYLYKDGNFLKIEEIESTIKTILRSNLVPDFIRSRKRRRLSFKRYIS
jgi:hypothetical protein